MPGGHQHELARAKVHCNDPYREAIWVVMELRGRAWNALV
jgi:hypothetical protein